MAKLVDVDDLNKALIGVLEDYNASIVKGLKRTTKRAMKDLVDNTKASAPVGNRSEHYRDSITSKTLSETKDGITKLWYVKGSDYRLTHLLNNGHALRDGGRYAGTNFVGKAVDAMIPWYLEEIEKVIKDG